MIRVGGIFMNVKAIMCDIDGTLLSSEGVVTKKTVEMIVFKHCLVLGVLKVW